VVAEAATDVAPAVVLVLADQDVAETASVAAGVEAATVV
jgi:hypothetical protein